MRTNTPPPDIGAPEIRMVGVFTGAVVGFPGDLLSVLTLFAFCGPDVVIDLGPLDTNLAPF
ncbi:hypothetical protein [Sphingobium sp. WCS2017Hpa-17]|uniref:hypothetical protein n=1 Tax=Sphingobium sp. WCS2017Hpa-17 TaxID=3073638 RepID=UPI00288AFF6D|nr:hypothetical protein [Sphingobium sp. WCS2017Hpa-17]